MNDPIEEHGVQIAGGAMHVRPTGDKGADADWIAHEQEQGIPVLTRTVIVVEDWHEVPKP